MAWGLSQKPSRETVSSSSFSLAFFRSTSKIAPEGDDALLQGGCLVQH